MSQDEIKASLEDCITSLESYQELFGGLTLKAKEWLDDADGKAEETTKLVRDHFTMIREAIDKKEKEIMQCLEMERKDHEATRELICKAQELIHEAPTITEDVKTLLKEWDSTKEPRADVVDKVALIKEKVESGNKIFKKLRIFEDCKLIIDTEGFVNGMKRVLEEVNGIQDVSISRALCSAPTGFARDMLFSTFVSFCWDNTGKYDEFILSKREEGGEWSDNDSLIHIDKKRDYCVVYPLKPSTKYEFRIKGRIDEMETGWSDTISAKTTMRYVIPAIESIVRGLPTVINNLPMCNAVIDSIGNMSLKGGGKLKLLLFLFAIYIII